MAEATPPPSTHKTEKPKRNFSTWVAGTMLLGMGTLCATATLGGIVFAAISISSGATLAAVGGLCVTATTGYALPYLTKAFREVMNPGSIAKEEDQRRIKNNRRTPNPFLDKV